MKHIKKTLFILVITLLFYTNKGYSQNKFILDIDAPDYINQTIQIAPQMSYENLNEFYKFKLNIKNKMIEKIKGLPMDIYKIKIQKKNIIEGESMLPISVCFLTKDTITNQFYITAPFYLDTGYIKIHLPKINSYYDLNVNTPLNIEYKKFKKIFIDLYVESPNYNHLFGFDSLISMYEKQKRIIDFINNNPNSYLPLWEIIDDYTSKIDFYNRNFVNKNIITLLKKSLPYFSETIKKTALYKMFIESIKIDSLRNIKDSIELIGKTTLNQGVLFPQINLSTSKKITKENFKNYKLTFIDFWATWCTPCIESFPKMVQMYNQYKDKGVQFISIADENTAEKIKLAKTILKKNKVEWINYFDKNKDLIKKIIYESIPFQILVDKDGKVITAVSGDLDEIKRAIEAYLKLESSK